MVRLVAFTSLGLSIGAAFYGHHSALWVLLSALISAAVLIPDDAVMTDTPATAGAGLPTVDEAPHDLLLEMVAQKYGQCGYLRPATLPPYPFAEALDWKSTLHPISPYGNREDSPAFSAMFDVDGAGYDDQDAIGRSFRDLRGYGLRGLCLAERHRRSSECSGRRLLKAD